MNTDNEDNQVNGYESTPSGGFVDILEDEIKIITQKGIFCQLTHCISVRFSLQGSNRPQQLSLYYF